MLRCVWGHMQSSVRKNTDVEDCQRPEGETGMMILKLLMQTDSVCLILHVAAKKKKTIHQQHQEPVLIRSDAE